jgi:hypothetical protein
VAQVRLIEQAFELEILGRLDRRRRIPTPAWDVENASTPTACASCFQALTGFGCTSYSLAIWAWVFSPFKASKATAAFNCAVIVFLIAVALPTLTTGCIIILIRGSVFGDHYTTGQRAKARKGMGYDNRDLIPGEQ